MDGLFGKGNGSPKDGDDNGDGRDEATGKTPGEAMGELMGETMGEAMDEATGGGVDDSIVRSMTSIGSRSGGGEGVHGSVGRARKYR
ncbi:hypothetical protein RSOLAG1IB_08566 [Rhizoctonia solani AG-1 IB]|uniref:Uncharacterized protein n=1 Tax=Thanatephorus cucumeris (strain AG1-IB / isolate 7/3/14) TaxID=1108050 RepID=A0A0B7FKG8_THACB|nr:hypothetical protein RSOLAG1IB_08566 [Rhizoctonia solani AG-1 IB]